MILPVSHIIPVVPYNLFGIFFYLRNSTLENKIAKYSVYERYLHKVTDIVPDGKFCCWKSDRSCSLH